VSIKIKNTFDWITRGKRHLQINQIEK